MLTWVYASHWFCFTFHEKCAYFLTNYCIIFEEKPIFEERERERERERSPRKAAGIHSVTFFTWILSYFSKETCILFNKLLHNLRGKADTRRERERERDLLEKLLVLTLVHTSHSFCSTFHSKCAYFLKNYCILL